MCYIESRNGGERFYISARSGAGLMAGDRGEKHDKIIHARLRSYHLHGSMVQKAGAIDQGIVF